MGGEKGQAPVSGTLSKVSNVLGTLNPVVEIVRIAHGRSVPVSIDGV
jgi:selenocysteine lyase/cysteine desulfurase